jgi:tetratricopeptide (TPR) repeat protein
MAAGRERAFEDLPPNAANVYLAAGRPADALRVISTPRVNWYLEDDQTGQLFPYGGGEASVLRALVMAGSGEIRTELDALERAWSGPGFTEHRRDLLRNDATLRMAPALAMDGRSRVEWQPRVGLEHPLWMGLITTPLNPQAARELIDAAMDEEAPGLSEAGRTFTAAIIATRAGLLAEAAQLLTRMDSLPAAIESFDSTWGLRAHALLLRAQALEELGQPDQAAEEYRRVLDQWVAPDSLVAPLLEEARGRLARLRQ